MSRLFSEELRSDRLGTTLITGALIGVLSVIETISIAALLFTGPLAPYISVGVGLTFVTTIVTMFVVALTSSLPGVVTLAEDSSAIVLAIMVGAIAAQIPAADPALLPTVMMALAIATGLVGIIYSILGIFELGDLIRYIPYPVVGGFLAGTGYLLAQGAFNVMTDRFFSLAELPTLMAPLMLARWLPGLGIGVVLMVLLRRYNKVFITPSVVMGSTLAFYLGLLLTQTPIETARSYGFLFETFPEGTLWQPLHWTLITQVKWSLIGAQAGTIAIMVLLAVISLLLNVSGIELAAQKDIDLNQELRSTGIANLLASLGGGVVGFHHLGFSTLSCAKMGSQSRLVGLLTASVCLAALFFGKPLIALLPKPVLGGAALFLGLSFLVEWVYDAWFKLSKVDYGLVILVLGVIASVGFLEGVGVGVLVSVAMFAVSYSRVNVTRHILSGATLQSNTARSFPQIQLLKREGEQIYILELQGFLFFGTARALVNTVQERLHDENSRPLRYVVLNFQWVTGLDSSAVIGFVKLKQQLQSRQIKLVFTDLKPPVETQLRRGDCLTSDDVSIKVFPDCDRGLEWCENAILKAAPLRRRRSLPLVLQLDDLFPNPGHASEFVSYLEKLDVTAQTTLFQPQQMADAIYLIEVGQVTVYLPPTQRQTYRLYTVGPGYWVGELSFFRQTSHQTSAVVDVPSSIYRLSTASFQKMQQARPEVATTFQLAVIAALSDRLTTAYQEIADLRQT